WAAARSAAAGVVVEVEAGEEEVVAAVAAVAVAGRTRTRDVSPSRPSADTHLTAINRPMQACLMQKPRRQCAASSPHSHVMRRTMYWRNSAAQWYDVYSNKSFSYLLRSSRIADGI